MANYLSKTLVETHDCPPEQKLWRAVLNQALMDAFEVNTIWICDYEKKNVDNFFRTRTQEFDEICDQAGIDPTRLWRKVQRLKGIKAGFILPYEKEQRTLNMFERFKRKRTNYSTSHWRNAYVG